MRDRRYRLLQFRRNRSCARSFLRPSPGMRSPFVLLLLSYVPFSKPAAAASEVRRTGHPDRSQSSATVTEAPRVQMSYGVCNVFSCLQDDSFHSSCEPCTSRSSRSVRNCGITAHSAVLMLCCTSASTRTEMIRTFLRTVSGAMSAKQCRRHCGGSPYSIVPQLPAMFRDASLWSAGPHAVGWAGMAPAEVCVQSIADGSTTTAQAMDEAQLAKQASMQMGAS
jgi:hypothetical protein